MPEFRCNMLDQRGDVLFPTDVVADDLEAALRHAISMLRTNQPASPLQRVYALEVWAGTNKLFRRELGALVDAMGDHGSAI